MQYKNFIEDFPKRCGKILDTYRDQDRKNGQEVTHMLAIASVAVTIPFERLRKPPDGIKHPAHDRERYDRANGEFANLCDQSFLTSCLWVDTKNSWKTGLVKKEAIRLDPGSWISDSDHLTETVKVKEVLERIRNALAHGSIFTLPNEKDEIKNIIFLSKDKAGGNFYGNFKMIVVLTEDFYKFLVKWISFLSDLNIPLEPN